MTNNKNPIAKYIFYQLGIAWKRFKRLIWITDEARSMGIHIMAGKGSGKSRLMGRVIAWLDFIRGVPQVIFDPHGPTIDNFLDKILYMPQEIQKEFWKRVLYVDMSGKDGKIIPFPLFYRFGNENLYEISQRYLDVVRKIDPFLQTASIEGWNPLWRVGTNCGMILAALGCQISEAEDLIIHPLDWQTPLSRALAEYPEIRPSIEFIKNINQMKEAIRNRRIESYFNKTSIFSLDTSMKTMFGSNQTGINWDEIVNRGITVLLDFRHEHDFERRRFKMAWAFNYFLDFVKHRGAGRHQPVGLMIDELTSLFSLQTLSSELFGSDMDELINVLARNYRVWLTIAHQEMFQLTERIIKSLMTMGTQILGVTTDPMAAKVLSELYFDYRPYWIKKYEPIYGSVYGAPALIDYTTVEFTIEEQLVMQSYYFQSQREFEFLVRVASGEGNIQSGIRRMSIAKLDAGIYPHPIYVPLARQKLMHRDGVPIEHILKEIDERKNSQLRLPQGKKANQKMDISIWD